MPPKKQDYIANIKINRELFLNAIDMAEKFSDCSLLEANLVITKRGMAMFGLNKDAYAGSAIFIKGETMEAWDIKTEFKRTMHEDVMKKLKDFIRKSHEKTVELTFTEIGVKIQIGNVKKKIEWPGDLEYLGQGEKMFRALQGYWTRTDPIGRIKITEITRYMQGASRFEGDKGRDLQLTMKDRGLTISTTISQGDELFLDLKGEIENCSEKELNVKFNADDIAQMISHAGKLTDSIHIIGATNQPLVISKEGTDPAEATSFNENLEFYVMIAPRIGD